MSQKQTTRSAQQTSWGTAAGVLAGCGVTLAGVALNLPPLTILLRAIVGGGIVAIMVSALAMGCQMMAPPKEEEDLH